MLCLVFASHNGVSESEIMDFFPELELPVLFSLLHHLNRLCITTLRCGLITFQHLQVIMLLDPINSRLKQSKCSALNNFLSHLCVWQACEAVRLEFLSGGSSSASYREKLIHYFSQQLRYCSSPPM